MTTLSVIIPLSAEETAWRNLISDLAQLPEGTEIIFVGPSNLSTVFEQGLLENKRVRVLTKASGRASQMNSGANIAEGKHLWFLHADSKFAQQTLPALFQALKTYPESLLFFDLAFLNDASFLMFINAWGVKFRSHCLKIPFGDQGFCMTKQLFQEMGGFKENVSYGEDHLFVWHAKQRGISIRSTGARLYTSARKYRQNGWFKTTLLHQYLWIKQAWPEWKKLLKESKR